MILFSNLRVTNNKLSFGLYPDRVITDPDFNEF